MYLRSEVTWKTFTAGCFLLALSPRVDAAQFFENPPALYSVNQTERLHLLPTSGTLGTGLEYRYDISKNVNLRFAYSSMNYAKSAISHSVSYDLSLKMLSRSVIFDWRPFGGSFRTSAGLRARLAFGRDRGLYNVGARATGTDERRSVVEGEFLSVSTT